MELRPLHDRVAVEVDSQEEKTAGGIIIPDNAQEKPIRGKIVAVGGGSLDNTGNRMPLDVKVGDKIIFGKWSGTEVKVNGKTLLVMKESDIMAVIN